MKLLALALAGIILITVVPVLSLSEKPEYEVITYEGGYSGVIVEIGQNLLDYDDEYIMLKAGYEDTDICVKIHGRPLKSGALENVLDYFGVSNCWSSMDNRLNYLKVLVALGLSEGNL